MNHSATQIVIPVKRLDRALRRLSRVLAPPERALLQEAMLRDMLVACEQATQIAEVLVVTSDATAQRCARDAGARHLPDHEPPEGINAAVAIGQKDAVVHGNRALVLTADLPLITAADIDALTTIATYAGGVVLVPSHTGDGTNALLIDPADGILTLLGHDSRARHLAAAAAAGMGVHTLEIPRIGLDIDTPADLRRLLELGPPAHTRRVCDTLALTTRLEAVLDS